MIKPVTMEVAKSKLCPMAMITHDPCVGDACMAWSTRPDGLGWCGRIQPQQTYEKCANCKHWENNDSKDPCRRCCNTHSSKWEGFDGGKGIALEAANG